MVLSIPNKLLWDQVAVTFYSWKENVDLIFHPKFTTPLFTRRRTLVICRGMEYYVFPQFYEKLDLFYVKMLMPLYYKKATKILTLSDDLQNDLHKYLRVPYEKMETLYSAPADIFFEKRDSSKAEIVRKKYNLPEQYLISVTRPYIGNKLYPRKNIDRTVKAFLALREKHPTLNLLLLGNRNYDYVQEVFGQEIANHPNIIYPGWVPQEDMPYLYSLSSVHVFPSFSESFGLPLVEAMASGSPTVTSTGGSCPEIVGDAAIKVDPTDLEGLTNAVDCILSDRQLRNRLIEKGLERARMFSWTKSAEKTIEIFKELCD
jgi:glycosyltransferase involved in cell wall biosynthesis